jgi:hypothetical protein
MDEFDLEMQPPEPPTAGAPEPEHVAPSVPLLKSPVPTPFAPRLSPRARVLRAGGILGVLLLALAVLVAMAPGVRSALSAVLIGGQRATAMLTPPFAAGGDQFAVEHRVPWGSLLVDGHPAPSLGVVVLPQRPPTWRGLMTFALPPGRHQVTYLADPFPPVHCTVSVPAAPQDTCPLERQGLVATLVPDAPATRLLDLGARVERLPPTEVTALAAAIQQELDVVASGEGDSVAPGDHYRGTDGQVVATAPLRAEPVFTLGRGTPAFVGVPCPVLCTLGGPVVLDTPDLWLLDAQVGLVWRYRDAAGQVLLPEGPAADPAFAQQEVAVQVAAQWLSAQNGPTGHWSATTLRDLPTVTDPLVCAVGAEYLTAVRVLPGAGTADATDPNYQWPNTAWSSPPAEASCVLAGGRTMDPHGHLTGTVALVLYRDGVLLAANDEAHRVLPELTIADAHERALARAVWPPPGGTGG